MKIAPKNPSRRECTVWAAHLPRRKFEFPFHSALQKLAVAKAHPDREASENGAESIPCEAPPLRGVLRHDSCIPPEPSKQPRQVKESNRILDDTRVQASLHAPSANHFAAKLCPNLRIRGVSHHRRPAPPARG